MSKWGNVMIPETLSIEVKCSQTRLLGYQDSEVIQATESHKAGKGSHGDA